MVLFFTFAKRLKVTNFPPSEFFLFASYKEPDQVDSTLKRSDNTDFLKRFVPQIFWSKQDNFPQEFPHECDRQNPNLAYRKGSESNIEEESCEESEESDQFSQAETIRRPVRVSKFSGNRNKVYTPRKSKDSRKIRKKKTERKKKKYHDHLGINESRFTFFGGLSNLMQMPPLEEPKDVFVSENSAEKEESGSKKKENKMNSDQLEQAREGVTEKKAGKVVFPNTPQKISKEENLKTKEESDKVQKSPVKETEMELFFEDQMSHPSAQKKNLGPSQAGKRPEPKKINSSSLNKIEIELSELSENENDPRREKTIELKGLKQADNSTKTFQEVPVEAYLDSPEKNDRSPFDDRLSEMTTKMKEGALSILSNCKQTWKEGLEIKGEAKRKNDKAVRILEEGIARLEELRRVVDKMYPSFTPE